MSGFTGQRKGAFNVGIPGLAIETPALPQYGRGAAKNALDLTLVLDTLSDLIIGCADFAAIISNDSDFASLYFKLRQLVKDGDLQPRAEINGVPLLLFTHGLAGVSAEMRSLGENIISIKTDIPLRQTPESVKQPASATHPVANRPTSNQPQISQTITESLSAKYSNEQLAGAVAIGFGRTRWEGLGSNTYTFTYTAVYGVIRGRWPESQEATPGRQAAFSRWFHDDIWPIMEKHGATVSNKYGPDPANYQYNLMWETRERLKVLNPEQ